MKPYIVTCGANGRAVIFGYSEDEPESGKPCTLHDARMVLFWSRECGGLLGLAANGPKTSTRITAKVSKTQTSPVREWVAVDAHEGVASWPAA